MIKQAEPAQPRLRIIAALDEAGGIGFHGKLPWHCASDLKYFKDKTEGCNVVCGRVTAQSLPPLPGRNKFVLSKNCPPELIDKGFTPMANLDQFEGWVIGGAQVYELALPVASEMHLTRINGKYAADTWFPKYDPREWRLRDLIMKPDCNIAIFIRV